MPLVGGKSKEKKVDTIIGDATDRLLLAVKKKMLRRKGRVDYDQVAREGFNVAMIERLKAL